MTEQASPPLAVLDTNVVLDWLVFEDPACAPLASALAAGRLLWIASPAMLAELAEVLRRPALDRWRAAADTAGARAQRLASPAPEAPPAVRLDGGPLCCRDRADQKFIDLALASRAAWLLTRDRALLALARPAARYGTWIGPPARWPGAA